MILYKDTAASFRNHVDDNKIVDVLRESFRNKLGIDPSREVSSWSNSLRAMESVVRRSGISDDCGVLIEYKIPLTSRRIDFVVSGESERRDRNFVIIELKQWETASDTEKDGIVETILGGGMVETTHPSYQAQSYRVLIEEYNENVAVKNIRLHSCAYLHNYGENDPEPLKAGQYAALISDTPLYLKHDAAALQAFLKHHVGCGRGMDILYDIQNGRIRPSKKLIEHVSEMFEGNREFILIDNQKVAYEKALDLARSVEEKTVLVVKGGPGTGKSVVSVNLLGGLLREEQNVVFVAPNAAFRNVMVEKLARGRTKQMLHSLFKGSSSFLELAENTFETAIVDEAHRLKNSKAYQYYGENQVEDIIKSARCSIMFIDDNQRVRPEDIGTVSSIRKAAKNLNASYHEIELDAQFRCSGAEGYINWLDHVLHIRETANYNGWNDGEFEFRIFSDPNTLLDAIRRKNRAGFNARMLAGYAWPWTNKGNPDGQVDDVIIEEYDFRMPWNSRKARTTWAIDDSGVEQVGCIHTAQGLEFDYVGVIIGKDLRFDPESMEYYVDWSSYKDSAGKKGLREEPEKLSELVRSIYKVLMSRGMKGCYVHIVDKEVEKYFRSRLEDPSIADSAAMQQDEPEELIPYVNSLPLLSLRAVANSAFDSIDGYFPLDDGNYVLHPVEGGPFPKDRFLVRVEGDSMEPKIPDGSICRFRLDPGGSRNGKIVLCLYGDPVSDSATAAVKIYHSIRDDEGNAEQIVLSSLNPEHAPVVIRGSEANLRVIGVIDTLQSQ